MSTLWEMAQTIRNEEQYARPPVGRDWNHEREADLADQPTADQHILRNRSNAFHETATALRGPHEFPKTICTSPRRAP